MNAAFLRLSQEIPDTLGPPPLPGGVATAVRFIFHVPQWIQIGGAIVGAIAVGVVAVVLWRRRHAIVGWVRARPVPVLGALAVAAALLAVAGTGFGVASWNYMMHDNDFCTGCHVMSTAFQRFAQSEHSELNCHDCHQQPLSASMRQLYLWVLERPEEIGEHAPVPDEVCANCHIRADPDSSWQRVVATAGHRVHLESDSAVLGEVACVTCHGQEVHRFVPPDVTCGQNGCHAPETTGIVLGAMAGQTTLHCTMCHDFRAVVGEQVPTRVATAQLVPREGQCFACHDMQRVIEAFDARQDPHEGVCGMCHNPHDQETPNAAWRTCADAGCHEQAETLTPFHRGIHAEVLAECETCHVAHTWEVVGTDCRSCHRVLP